MSNDIQQLKSELSNRSIKFIYFAGSWCHMCIQSTPQIMDIFNKAEVNTDNIEIHSVNAYKTEPREAINKYSIKRIPTLVVEEKGNEIGRITEYTDKSWLDDILNILEK